MRRLWDAIPRLLGRGPEVHWPTAVEEDLQRRSLRLTREQIDGALQRTFPRARAVLVQRWCEGHRDIRERAILLVDVRQAHGPGSYVVKIGCEKQAEAIRDERRACRHCWPRGVRHDPVLMPFAEGCDWAGLSTFVYGDAEQFIHTGEMGNLLSLQEAVLQCVCGGHGAPTVTSMCELLFQLYERLDARLYAHRPREVDPKGTPFSLPRLWDALQIWDDEEGERRLRDYPGRYPMIRTVRQTANHSNEAAGRDLDPVDYLLRYVKPYTSWRVPRREVTGHDEDEGFLDLPATEKTPGPARALLPAFVYGLSHGDLHGLNVLVGKIDSRVLWPAVFDYEHMARDNRIAWDFVKMETELKMRALARVHQDDRLGLCAFSNRVQTFEWELNAWTVHGHEVGWPSVGDLPGPPPPGSRRDAGPRLEPLRSHEDELCRLRAILLEIRQRACRILGRRGKHSGQGWLREYLFLLMCYGVCCVRFTNLKEPPPLMAAFKSASVAAHWVCNELPN